MASRRDMEQVLCCHVKEALECGDMEFVKAAKIFEKAYNKLDDEIKENAQRNYRTLIYPYVRFSMVATHSKNAPIECSDRKYHKSSITWGGKGCVLTACIYSKPVLFSFNQ